MYMKINTTQTERIKYKTMQRLSCLMSLREIKIIKSLFHLNR